MVTVVSQHKLAFLVFHVDEVRAIVYNLLHQERLLGAGFSLTGSSSSCGQLGT